jgi:hypothetical protein
MAKPATKTAVLSNSLFLICVSFCLPPAVDLAAVIPATFAATDAIGKTNLRKMSSSERDAAQN